MVTSEWSLSTVRGLPVTSDAIINITSTPNNVAFETIDASGAIRKHGDATTPETIVYNGDAFGWPAKFKFSKSGYKIFEFNLSKDEIHERESNLHVTLEPITEGTASGKVVSSLLNIPIPLVKVTFGSFSTNTNF